MENEFKTLEDLVEYMDQFTTRMFIIDDVGEGWLLRRGRFLDGSLAILAVCVLINNLDHRSPFEIRTIDLLNKDRMANESLKPIFPIEHVRSS